MTKVVAFAAQKGGVGKSTLARALAREAFMNGWHVKLADLDVQQGTSLEWHRRRLQNGQAPVASVELIPTAKSALDLIGSADLLILDCAARASQATLEIAKQATLMVLPTGPSEDDLTPAIELARGLVQENIPHHKIAFALTRSGTVKEEATTRATIEAKGFQVLDGSLPEKPAYRTAQNEGLAVTECRYASLREKAEGLLQSLADLLMSQRP